MCELAKTVRGACAAMVMLAGCARAGADGAAELLVEEFPEHAAHVLGTADLLTSEDFIPPRTAAEAWTLRFGDHALVVHEIGARGPVASTTTGVSFERPGGRSFWSRARGGFEEWLLMDVSGLPGGPSVVSEWRVPGHELRMTGEVVEVLTPGAPTVRVAAPAAWVGTQPVNVRLSVEGDLIRLALVLTDPPTGWALIDPQWTATLGADDYRFKHAAVALKNGNVLFTGGYYSGSVIYDWQSDLFTGAAARTLTQQDASATLLADGRVLVTGGRYFGGPSAFAEVYEPISNTWATLPSMNIARANHQSWLLSDGRVLVLGGQGSTHCEFFEPDSGTWSLAPAMQAPHESSVQLSNGSVLAVRGPGLPDGGDLAELFDPSTNLWTQVSAPTIARGSPTFTSTGDNQAVLAGGVLIGELFTLDGGLWQPTGPMTRTRSTHSAVRLADGRVLATGGVGAHPDGGRNRSAEVFDPRSNAWSSVEDMSWNHTEHTSTLLPNSRVLLSSGPYGHAELFSPPCATAEACLPGNYCNQGFCEPKRALGLACGTSASCLSGFCVAQRCCASACEGPCEGCNLPGSVGTCALRQPGTPSADPFACHPFVCNGSATCPTTCAVDADCYGDFQCLDGACGFPQPDAGPPAGKPDAGPPAKPDGGSTPPGTVSRCGCSGAGSALALATLLGGARGRTRRATRPPSL